MAELDKRELDRQISEYEDGKLTRTNARDLAALYIIRDYLYPDPEQPFSGPPAKGISGAGPDAAGIPLYGDTPFFRAIAGKPPESAWRVVSQLADTLAAVSPPLYKVLIEQISALPDA